MLTPAPRAPTDRSSFCVFLRLFAACRAVGLAKGGLFPDSLPLSVFVSSADVAKGGDGAKSSLCEIFLRLLLRVDSRFLFAACHAVACEGGSIRGCYSRSACESAMPPNLLQRMLSKDLALLIPSRAVLNNPVHQGTVKADVEAGFLAFDPFVSEDLRSFGQEFLIQG